MTKIILYSTVFLNTYNYYMNYYEHTYITVPELNEEGSNSIKEKIEEILKKNDSKIVKEENWGVRSLAYSIKKNYRGKYSNLYIQGNSKVIKELEKFERYDERIIKFLSMKIKKIPEEEAGLTVTS